MDLSVPAGVGGCPSTLPATAALPDQRAAPSFPPLCSLSATMSTPPPHRSLFAHLMHKPASGPGALNHCGLGSQMTRRHQRGAEAPCTVGRSKISAKRAKVVCTEDCTFNRSYLLAVGSRNARKTYIIVYIDLTYLIGAHLVCYLIFCRIDST